jgi:hypothetical protein
MVAVERVAEFFETVGEGATTGVFAEDELLVWPAPTDSGVMIS